MASYKERVRAAILEQVHARNLCDERDAAFCAAADALPDGSYGIVLLALDGNRLNICDIDIHNNIGRIIDTITLTDVRNFKVGRSLLASTLCFTYGGFDYFFRNIVGMKAQLEAIASEAGPNK